jgi:hypothetical protein
MHLYTRIYRCRFSSRRDDVLLCAQCRAHNDGMDVANDDMDVIFRFLSFFMINLDILFIKF